MAHYDLIKGFNQRKTYYSALFMCTGKFQGIYSSRINVFAWNECRVFVKQFRSRTTDSRPKAVAVRGNWTAFWWTMQNAPRCQRYFYWETRGSSIVGHARGWEPVAEISCFSGSGDVSRHPLRSGGSSLGSFQVHTERRSLCVVEYGRCLGAV